MLVALVYSLLRLFLDLFDVRLRDQDPEAELVGHTYSSDNGYATKAHR